MRSFWDRLDRSGGPGACWLWTGARSSSGYGTLKVGGRTVLAHRRAYELARGSIAPGLVVMHACDQRPCCNPAHLSLGSHRDNARDRSRKGRTRGGWGRPARANPDRRYW